MISELENKPYALITILFLCSFLIGPAYGGGTGSTPKGKPFVEIQGQFVEVQGQIGSLEEQMDALVGQVESLELRVTANETAISGLEAANVIIIQQIGELVSASATNSTDVANALTQIGDLQTQIDDLRLAPDVNAQAIADLKDQVTTLQNLISSNTEGLLTLQSDLENNYVLISAFQEQIDLINEELATKQDVLTGQCPDGTVLVDFDGLGNIECESLNATAGIQKNTITQLFTASGVQLHTHSYDCGYSHDHGIFSGNRNHWHSQSCYYTEQHGGGGSASITCPDGSFLSGGGFINDHPEAISITENHSTGTFDHPGQSWMVTATNSSATSYDVYATADCVTFLP